MNKVSFKINNKIKIQAEDGEYHSNIQDVTEEYIYISIPVNNGSYLPLKEEEEVSVLYYDENELYQFDGKVIKREKGNIPTIVLEQPKHLRRIQRRNYVRISHMIEGCYLKVEKKIKEEEREIFFENSKEEFKRAIIIDISGGGCKLRMEQELKRGEMILLRFEVENQILDLMCKVLRVYKDENGFYECGVAYLDLDEKIREKIVRYIFKVMRQQRQKGLIC